MNMNRHANGSWGQLQIDVALPEDQTKLLVFDDQNSTKNEDGLDTYPLTEKVVEYLTGMPYADKGWLDKKIFIANRHPTEKATIRYTYMGSVYLKVY